MLHTNKNIRQNIRLLDEIDIYKMQNISKSNNDVIEQLVEKLQVTAGYSSLQLYTCMKVKNEIKYKKI